MRSVSPDPNGVQLRLSETNTIKHPFERNDMEEINDPITVKISQETSRGNSEQRGNDVHKFELGMV